MAKPEPSIFAHSDPEAEERALLKAEADIDAGRFVSHEEVSRWLMTWGTPEEGPPPKEWGLDNWGRLVSPSPSQSSVHSAVCQAVQPVGGPAACVTTA